MTLWRSEFGIKNSKYYLIYFKLFIVLIVLISNFIIEARTLWRSVLGILQKDLFEFVRSYRRMLGLVFFLLLI